MGLWVYQWGYSDWRLLNFTIIKIRELSSNSWEEIKLVRAHVMFKGEVYSCIYIDTNSSKTFQFVSKDSGRTLKVMRIYWKRENREN